MDIHTSPELGQVIGTNSYTLASMARVYGGEPKILGIVPDVLEELEKAIDEALKYDIGIFFREALRLGNMIIFQTFSKKEES